MVAGVLPFLSCLGGEGRGSGRGSMVLGRGVTAGHVGGVGELGLFVWGSVENKYGRGLLVDQKKF